jgi:HK97 gp10 family phage protein
MSVDFKSNSAAVRAQIGANIAKCLTAIGLKQNELVVEEITNMEAVDTGRMRASNTYRLGDKEVIVGNTANYAVFVNCGTRFVGKRPFMENSVLNHKSKYEQIMKEILGQGF